MFNYALLILGLFLTQFNIAFANQEDTSKEPSRKQRLNKVIASEEFIQGSHVISDISKIIADKKKELLEKCTDALLLKAQILPSKASSEELANAQLQWLRDRKIFYPTPHQLDLALSRGPEGLSALLSEYIKPLIDEGILHEENLTSYIIGLQLKYHLSNTEAFYKALVGLLSSGTQTESGQAVTLQSHRDIRMFLDDSFPNLGQRQQSAVINALISRIQILFPEDEAQSIIILKPELLGDETGSTQTQTTAKFLEKVSLNNLELRLAVQDLLFRKSENFYVKVSQQTSHSKIGYFFRSLWLATKLFIKDKSSKFKFAGRKRVPLLTMALGLSLMAGSDLLLNKDPYIKQGLRIIERQISKWDIASIEAQVNQLTTELKETELTLSFRKTPPQMPEKDFADLQKEFDELCDIGLFDGEEKQATNARKLKTRLIQTQSHMSREQYIETLDRIVKGISDYGKLKTAKEHPGIYSTIKISMDEVDPRLGLPSIFIEGIKAKIRLEADSWSDIASGDYKKEVKTLLTDWNTPETISIEELELRVKILKERLALKSAELQKITSELKAQQ